MVKMNTRARSFFWWPKIDEEIEDISNTCMQCKQNRPKQTWPSTHRPFRRVHIDFLGPFHRKMFLIVIDSSAKWVEVFRMSSPSALSTIEKKTEERRKLKKN